MEGNADLNNFNNFLKKVLKVLHDKAPSNENGWNTDKDEIGVTEQCYLPLLFNPGFNL